MKSLLRSETIVEVLRYGLIYSCTNNLISVDIGVDADKND
jgi:hypothetical protein